MTDPWVLAALGRSETPAHYDATLLPARILITGAGGSLGSAIIERLDAVGPKVYATDVDDLDVTWPETPHRIQEITPDVVLHMAGAKHAPAGEEDPAHPFRVHVEGTANVLRGAERIGARVVMASTCKACDPETAYGASKLVAERLVLNAGGTVVRFHNVIETQGNVFEIWQGMVDDDPQPLPVTPCSRRFITTNEAVSLTLWAAMRTQPAGRYICWPTLSRDMRDVLHDVWPLAPFREIPPRRGDRMHEPEHARCESLEIADCGVARVENPHDV